MRLLFWGDLQGLDLRQRLHFAELGLFYLQSFATLIFIACPIIGFLAVVYPLVTKSTDYVAPLLAVRGLDRALPVALTAGRPYERLWRARQMWVGLAPVYAKACLLALAGGRHRKPEYRVTRKHDELRWYWRETLVQTALLVILVAVAVRTVLTGSLLYEVDLGSLYWTAFFGLTLGSFVRLSWFRAGPRARLRRRRELRAAIEARPEATR